MVVSPTKFDRNFEANHFRRHFEDDECSSVEILVRETFQNPLNTRSIGSVVRVEYKSVTLNLFISEFARSIFSDDGIKHFRCGELIESDERPTQMTFFAIENFGITDGTHSGFVRGENEKNQWGLVKEQLSSQLRGVFSTWSYQFKYSSLEYDGSSEIRK